MRVGPEDAESRMSQGGRQDGGYQGFTLARARMLDLLKARCFSEAPGTFIFSPSSRAGERISISDSFPTTISRKLKPKLNSKLQTPNPKLPTDLNLKTETELKLKLSLQLPTDFKPPLPTGKLS